MHEGSYNFILLLLLQVNNNIQTTWSSERGPVKIAEFGVPP